MFISSYQFIKGFKQMTFEELKEICSLMWGQSWQSELARCLNIDRRVVANWKRQGVAKWVYLELKKVVLKRQDEIKKAQEIYNDIGT